MNKTLRHLLQACSLISCCYAAPLAVLAQTPSTGTPAASAASAPAATAPAATAPAHPAASPAPAAAAPATPPAPPPPPLSKKDGSYLVGVQFGESLHQFGITTEVSQDQIIRGLKDGMKGKKLEQNDRRSLQTFIHSLMDEITKRNLAEGKQFLEKNGHQKDVTTTTSGLQYKILTPGDSSAASPTPTDQVTVQYRGRLLNGSEFDSSFNRPTPTTFGVNAIIKGWQEALLLMKPGAKWRLWIPAELAYGNSPRPGIPAGSTLDFEVELVSAAPAPPPPPKPAAAPGMPRPGNGALPPAQALPVPPPAAAPQPKQ